MKLSFTKMQGCANDYIYLDCRTSGVPEEIAALSERLSRRHFSIGADGIICICAPVTAGADAMMRIFNADGSEGKMCGNGIRCVAEWLYTHGIAKPKLAIDTLSGLKTVSRMGEGLWQVEMGTYTAMAAALPAVNMGEGPLVDLPLQVEENLWRVTCISVGNPHCVTIVPEVDSLKLEQIGPGFEHHENFPERINTEFVQVVDATVVETGGFAVFNDREKLHFLRKLAEKRGLILLTDSDGAGFVIRNYLKGALPKERIKQAYIPDVFGKERRKRKAGKEGKLGVEGMTPEILLEALRRSGATFSGEDAAERQAAITKADLLEKGLIGAGSAQRRRELLQKLELPEHLTPNAMLEMLNLLMSREEFYERQ